MMNIKYFLAISLVSFSACFSERYIKSTKYDYQEEIMVKGLSVIASQKINFVKMCQISETIDDQMGDFSFNITNCSEKPITLYVKNLKVSDQKGRQIRCITKKELLEANESSRFWRMFGCAVGAGLQSVNAQSAGNIDYQSNTCGSYNSNVRVVGSNGCASGTISGHGSSSTSGTVHVEALRQQAQRQVAQDTAANCNFIDATHNGVSARLKYNYFDSNTIFPGTSYSAIFRIKMSSDIEDELKYLKFTYDLGEEKHTFCFDCGKKVKKWYHFGC